jgi:hypothetical protein
VLAQDSDIRHHLPRLRRLAHGTVVELGVRDGNSTAALLAGVEENGGTVWSVDVDETSQSIFQGHPQWHFVLADSRDAASVEAAGLTGEVDVLFVDTLHTYEQVSDELTVWGGRMRKGGTIAFHDTDSFPEIRRAVAEWARARGTAYVFLPRSNGLGLAYLGRGRAYALLKSVERAARRPAEAGRVLGCRFITSLRWRVSQLR